MLVGVLTDFHALSCYPHRRCPFASSAYRVAYSVRGVFSSTDSSVATLNHTQLLSAIFLCFYIPSDPSRRWRLRHESGRCVTGVYVVQTGGSGHARHLSAVLLVRTLACTILMTSTQFQQCPRSLLTCPNHLRPSGACSTLSSTSGLPAPAQKVRFRSCRCISHFFIVFSDTFAALHISQHGHCGSMANR